METRDRHLSVRTLATKGAAAWVARVCTGVLLCAAPAGATVAVTRGLPAAVLTTTSTFQTTLAVTVSGGAPSALVLAEQLPSGWTITAATWQGQAFAPVLISGTYKWLFEEATGTATAVGNGTLIYTVNTGGAAAGGYSFAGTAKWLAGGTEMQAVGAGDTEISVCLPTTVTAVTVQTGATVEVAFSAAMGTGVESAANYVLSGTGKGTLNPHPDSVALKGGNAYTLTWNSGEMLNGGDITIAVTGALDGHGLPLGSPNSGTDSGHAIGVAPTATISYAPAAATKGNVVATLQPSEAVTVTNNGGNATCTLTDNGSFTFQFTDAAGNAGSATATVTWIDRTPPTVPVANRVPAPDSTVTTQAFHLEVTFDEAVVGVDASDLVLSGTSAIAAQVDSVTDLGANTWRFAISGLKPGSGTLTVTLAPDAADIRDAAGNDLAAVTWSYAVLIPVYHPYDANQDWVLSASELQTMKDAWAVGGLAGGSDQDYYLLWTIDLWKAGAYHDDQAQTGYRMWQPGSP